MITLLSALIVLGCNRAPGYTMAERKRESWPESIAGSKVEAPKPDPVPIVQATPNPNVKRVLVVINEASQESVAVGEYYVQRRSIPAANVLRIKTTSRYIVALSEFEKTMRDPIVAAAKKNPDIDFIVMTKGVPARIDERPQLSTDSVIASFQLGLPTVSGKDIQELKQIFSPYFNKREPFDSQKYKMWLVTRLDGYTVEDAKRLVDSSIAAKPEKGLFLLDGDPTKNNTNFTGLPEALGAAEKQLKERGFNVRFDNTREYVGVSDKLMGYVTWGSNDANFSQLLYEGQRFQPGSIAETFVSTSARRMHVDTAEKGQSLIGDLIRKGVTGVKGYVTEPYSVALARPEVLFERYTAGFNLAESFYMASILTNWKDVVIGDPLCAPYAKPNP